MPWTTITTMDQRAEFVQFAMSEQFTIAELCRRYHISRKTGYKWLERYRAEPAIDTPVDTTVSHAVLAHGSRSQFQDLSRRPKRSPLQVSTELEDRIVGLRRQHPFWGARKLRVLLREQLEQELGSHRSRIPLRKLPAVSTVHQVLVRHGLITAEATAAATPYIRFEHPLPNALWQMDYKGHVGLLNGARCHPLTVLDDHSRFNVVLHAGKDERTLTVQNALEQALRLYGLPHRMTMDNGSPWGSDGSHPITPLTIWLMRLGIQVSHSRPYHPQTQGKDERFHRTLKREVLSNRSFLSFEEAQNVFDAWRDLYNYQRPHEAIGMQRPAQRYYPSPRSFPEVLPPIEYDERAEVRKVQDGGEVHFHGRIVRTHKALKGLPVAFLPTENDGCFLLQFIHTPLKVISLHEAPEGGLIEGLTGG